MKRNCWSRCTGGRDGSVRLHGAHGDGGARPQPGSRCPLSDSDSGRAEKARAIVGSGRRGCLSTAGGEVWTRSCSTSTWQHIKFLSKKSRHKLSDAQLRALLTRVDARSHTKSISLRGCVSVTGSGLSRGHDPKQYVRQLRRCDQPYKDREDEAMQMLRDVLLRVVQSGALEHVRTVQAAQALPALPRVQCRGPGVGRPRTADCANAAPRRSKMILTLTIL